MSSSRFPDGFTLVELLVVLVVLAVLVAGLSMPLATQVQLRRQEETRRLLDTAQEALLGFAAAHGRLPCPASESSRGSESFAPGGDATNGDCSHFHDGYLPAASLGLSGLDPEGFLRDAWMTPRNRIRYAVHGGGSAVNGVVNPLTRTHGMQSATLAGMGAASHYLFICLDGTLVASSSCGTAANQLTRRAAFVLVSPGANAASAPASPHEGRNLDGDGVFVWREPSDVPGHQYDDQLQWVAVHLVVHRLVSAGRLP